MTFKGQTSNHPLTLSRKEKIDNNEVEIDEALSTYRNLYDIWNILYLILWKVGEVGFKFVSKIPSSFDAV